MRRLIIILLLLFAVADAATAQRISHSFNNVSMSDALKYIQQQTSKHKIIFIYNELEDFKVTRHRFATSRCPRPSSSSSGSIRSA